MSIKNLHYRYPGGVTGDTMPFFYEGEYHMMLLNSCDLPGMGRNGDSWTHVKSKDLLSWEVLNPCAIEKSDDPQQPDCDGTFTGSVVEKDGVFHMFYTGFNRENEYHQTICHALSTDGMRTWVRDANNPIIKSDGVCYEKADWRDSDVFWNEDEGCWWMLICARENKGPSLKRGCIVLARSQDLYKWEVESEPLYAPHVAHCMECPHMFKWNDKWYLMFSRYCTEQKTHYRISDSCRGPWVTPYPDALDTRRFYAAKSAFDGKNRVALAWIFTRTYDDDNGAFEWGGDLGIAHVLTQLPDGRLQSTCPDTVVNAYRDTIIPLDFQPGCFGGFEKREDVYVGNSDGYVYAQIGHEAGPVLLEAEFEAQDITEECGILLKCKDDITKGYRLGIRPKEDRCILAMWPEKLDPLWTFMASFTGGLEEPELSTDGYPPACVFLDLQGSRKFNIKLFITGTMIEAFINDKAVLSYRIYNAADGMIGLYTNGGETVFTKLILSKPLD